MNSDNDSFNLTIFTNTTKKLCLCSTVSIFIIFLFVISPLSNFFKTSLFMKIIALFILGYTIYLNVHQSNSLRSVLSSDNNKEVTYQLNMNLICSYMFTVFICILFIFVIKSF
jgi:uncharacterized membrane-anchored protein YitT (DUF2179 family)